MKILKIELRHFKHFVLSDYHGIKIDFNSPITLILGSNGSGKTSLMSQLNPMPATDKDFSTDGYKRIVIEKDGIEYTLVSERLKSKWTHSFLKYSDTDSPEELNASRLQSGQLELVEHIFGFTPKVRSILSGQDRLSSMTPSQVMKTVTSISNMNMDFCMDLWNKAKDRQSEAKHILTHINRKLTEMEMERITDEERQAIEVRMETLRKEWTEVRSFCDTLQGLKQDVVTLPEPKVDQTFDHIPSGHGSSIEEIDSEISRIKSALSYSEGLHKSTLLQISDLQRMENAINESTNGSGVDGVNDRIQELLQVDYTQLAGSPPRDSLVRDNLDLEVLEHKVVNFLGTMEMDPRTHESSLDVIIEAPDKYSKAVTALARLKALLNDRIQVSDALKIEIKHMETHLDDVVKCVQCGHNNYLESSVSPENLEALKRKLNQELQPEIVKLEDAIAVTERTVDDLNVIVTYRNNVHQMFNQYHELLKKLDVSFPYIYTSVPMVLERIRCMLRDNRRFIEIIDQECELEKLIKLKESIEREDSHRSNLKLSALERELEEQLEEISRLGGRLTDYTTARSKILRRMEERESLTRYYHAHMETMGQDMIRELYVAYMATLKDIEASLAAWARKANEAETAAEKILELENEKAVYTDNLNHATILVSELSPTTGLIAHYLGGYMQAFFNKVNEIINSVFEDDLEVCVSGRDSGGLEYKFPLKVDGRESGTITTASFGQRDIIDFAFSHVMTHAMGLSEFPMYLDEMGSTFDDCHRSNWVYFVRQMLETNQVNQIFMISHFATVHGGMTNYQVVVLSEKNIQLVPDNANEDVEFIY